MRLLFVLREQSGPDDCPLELHDESLTASVSKLIDDYGRHDCGRFCNSIDSNGSVCFSLSSLFLTEEPHEQVVHPTPQTSMQTKTNPTSQQSPADS